ncbi:MAG: KEOPS complex N(6)-L-threonylcarbamoyladenine synthase Kae1 [Candidatus Woesearchaeota archaeon]
MIILGIESTAHTFGIGILNGKKILANEKDSYTTEFGGIIPVEAGKHHKAVKEDVLKRALEKASVTLEDIDLITFSQGPGLPPCLRVGTEFAAELSYKTQKPIVGVNHCIAHLEVGSLISKAKNPLLLYASGANTQVIAYEANKYRVFGETIDIGVGNFLDSFARELGIGFPGGPKIAELALKGKRYVELPYVVKGMDVSFGGILTNCKEKIKLIRSGKVDYTIEDLCYSVQETIFAMLLEVTERALFHCNKKELLLGGGVCCNKRLQEMCLKMGSQNNIKVFIPENSLLVDNGVMIAWLGYKMFIADSKRFSPIKSFDDIKNLTFSPNERTDDVFVFWK